MTKAELLAAWFEIRDLAEAARAAHEHDIHHPLCQWGYGDEQEFKAAWKFIEAVLKYDPTLEQNNEI